MDMDILEDILTPEECAKYIDLINDGENVEIINRPFYASYYRKLVMDSNFTNVLYERLDKLGLIEKYNIKYLNNCLRLSKYDEGGEFKIHKDGFFQDKLGNRSFMTLNIFLNNDFEDGGTSFYDENKNLVMTADPKPGKGVIFDSQIYHSGNIVKNGNKYLLRTDAMK